MRKGIVFLLVAAVLLLGGVAAVFENATVGANSWKLPRFDPRFPNSGIIIVPNGDPLPPAPG